MRRNNAATDWHAAREAVSAAKISDKPTRSADPGDKKIVQPQPVKAPPRPKAKPAKSTQRKEADA